MASSIGNSIKLTLFGESHGQGVGCVIDGLPPNYKLNKSLIGKRLNQRKPGQALTTPRVESDEYEILSGYFNDKTTGAPLTVWFVSNNTHSKDYEALKHVFRPGHADYVGHVKSDGANDYRGGGHFSARLTAPLVFAGAIAEDLLNQKGIQVVSHIHQIGSEKSISISRFGIFNEDLERLNDAPYGIYQDAKMRLLDVVESARSQGDSVGAIIETSVFELPIGLGAPFFDSAESQLSHALFSIPGIKGVSFGDGFDFASKLGSEVIDAFVLDHLGRVQTNANHNGGINGGLTNGMPLTFKCVLKPTASISKAQNTLDFQTKEMTELKIEGRHDPCIALRAVPIVKAMTALTLVDMMMAHQSTFTDD